MKIYHLTARAWKVLDIARNVEHRKVDIYPRVSNEDNFEKKKLPVMDDQKNQLNYKISFNPELVCKISLKKN